MSNSILKEPKNFIGAKPLLFDRLIDDNLNEVHESGDQSFFDLYKVKESIRIEVSRLLNTRSSGIESADVVQDRDLYGTPSLYGIPDFTRFEVTTEQEWPSIENILKKTIMRFEPRLKDANAKILRFDNLTQSLVVQIDAKLIIKKISEEVTFAVAIECGMDH